MRSRLITTSFHSQDYLVTRYIAEFINSLSNLAYIFYAIYGLRKLLHKWNVDFFRALPYWGFLLLEYAPASTIWLFIIIHKYVRSRDVYISLSAADCDYSTDLFIIVDDLSMHLTTIPILHRVLTVDASREQSIKIALGLAIGLGVFVVYHVITDELLIHSTLFVVSVAIIGWRTAQLINIRTWINSTARRRIWGMVRFGARLFHFIHIRYFVCSH